MILHTFSCIPFYGNPKFMFSNHLLEILHLKINYLCLYSVEIKVECLNSRSVAYSTGIYPIMDCIKYWGWSQTLQFC